MSQKANYNTETYFIVINKHLQKVPHEKFITFDTSFIFLFFFQFDTEHSIIYIYIKLLNFDAAFPISKKKCMGFFFSSV